MDNYIKAIKTYDIRGILGKEIDTTFVYILAKAVGVYMIDNFGNDTKIMISKDVRPANTDLLPYFIQGLLDVGIKNIDYIGTCSTSVSYYVGQGIYDICVVFTASHNPPEYVGLKFFDKNTNFLSQSLLQELFLKEYKNKSDINVMISSEVKQFLGDSGEKEVDEKITSLFSLLLDKYKSTTQKHSFVVDFSNGSATLYERKFFDLLNQKLGYNIVFINEEPDGTFPNHLSDTQDHENYQQCLAKVKEVGAEFGIMFDGDADRIGLITKSGKVVGGDLVLTIIAKQMLETNGYVDAKIVYEVMCSNIVKQKVEEYGHEAILSKMGRFFIKEKMDEVDAVLGGETSGHFMFKEIGGYEMPLLALFYILLEIEEQGDMDDIIGGLTKNPKSPVLSVKVDDKNAVIEKIKSIYSDYDIVTIDGVSVFGNDFWFNVRPSNTENKIRYTLQANNEDILNRELSKLQDILFG